MVPKDVTACLLLDPVFPSLEEMATFETEEAYAAPGRQGKENAGPKNRTGLGEQNTCSLSSVWYLVLLGAR